MKKIIKVLIILVAIISLFGCANTNGTTIKKNQIGAKVLTRDEKNIVDLINTGGVTFNYTSFVDFDESNYKNLDIWIESYKDGILVSKKSVANIGYDKKDYKGQIAIISNSQSNMEKPGLIDWRIIESDSDNKGGNASSYRFSTKNRK